MPGNSLALQMPPAHPFQNFDSDPEFLYLHSGVPELNPWDFPRSGLNGPFMTPWLPTAHAALSAPKPAPRTAATLPWAPSPCCYPTRSPTLPLTNRGKGLQPGGLRGRRRGLQWTMEDFLSTPARLRVGELGGSIRSANKLTTHSKALFLFSFSLPPLPYLFYACVPPDEGSTQ